LLLEAVLGVGASVAVAALVAYLLGTPALQQVLHTM